MSVPPTRPLRVAIWTSTLGQGGTERNIVAYCRNFNPNVVVPEVWALRKTEGELTRQLLSAGVDVHELHGKRSVAFAFSVAKLMKHLPVDLIHVVLPTPAYFAVLSRYAFGCRIPFVFSEGAVQASLPFQKSLYRHFLSLCFNPIICNSDAVRDYMVSLGVSAAKLRVIGNGHDLSKYEISKRICWEDVGLDSKLPTIVSVGRLIESKRHVDLLCAARLMRERGIAFNLVIVGDGPLRQELEEFLASHLLPNVRLLGQRDDVAVLLRSSDVFAFSSISEGLPNAVIEAALCELPIVAVDIPGVREVAGDHAWYTTAKNPNGLAEQLIAVLASLTHVETKNRVHALGESATQRFSLDSSVAKLQDAYLDAVSACGESR